jgi:phosphoglycolate phosphatase
MASPTLVFDLDGTLVDTAPDLIAAANHALVASGHQAVAPELLRPQISHGARRLIETGLSAQDIAATREHLEAMHERFMEHYCTNIAVASRPFPGVIEVLEHWRRRGAKLAVCTNKKEALAVQVLDALRLSRLFVAVSGGDTFQFCKPDPQHLLETIRQAGGDRALAIMVGDSATDVATAKAAGIGVVGVTFGYTDVPMTSLGADAGTARACAGTEWIEVTHCCII